jgi:peptidoglycan/xylan/chitin deacetylase (PgdA/CDA1 family)
MSAVNICFHGIGTPGRDLEPGEDQYWVSVDQFCALLDEVTGWPGIRLSFDDGNSSDVHYGLPALTERGLTADFFVIVGRLSTVGSIGEDEVRHLRSAGMGIGCHGLTHRSWRGMDDATTHAELVRARDRLAEVAATPIREAACPRGQYDRAALAACRRAGYAAVYTSDRRPASPGAWLQPRFSVRRDDTPQSLRALVAAAGRPATRLRLAAVGTVKRWR